MHEGRNRRILVIDDNESIHVDFQKILGVSGEDGEELRDQRASLFGEQLNPRQATKFDIDSAFQGQEGLDLVTKAIQESMPYAMAFIDVRMPPGWDGIETIDRIWQEAPDLQVVICTAFSDHSWEDMIDRLGETDNLLILKKPFDTMEVRQLACALTMKWLHAQEAKIDPLTCIPNRRAFYDQLKNELERSRRYGAPLSCVTIDVDHFKVINDRHGHAAGDIVLKEVSRLLSQNSRGSDSVFRQGGDEFCALLSETSEQIAALWADRLRMAIAELKVSSKHETIHITASFGVAEAGKISTTPADLVEHTDIALREAKAAGRNQVNLYSGISGHQGENQEEDTPHDHPLRSVLAADIMTSAIMTLRQDNTLSAASQMFLQLRVNSVPVVNHDFRLVGIISEKDILRGQMSKQFWNLPIRDVMTPNVVSYEEDTPARTIHDFLCRTTLRRVVIVKDGKPTGVISRGTVLRWFGNWGGVRSKDFDMCSSHSDLRESLQIRDRISKTTEMLADYAKQLEDHLAGDRDAPCVFCLIVHEEDPCVCPIVHEVSRIQELCIDLLAYSQSHYSFDPSDEADELVAEPCPCGSGQKYKKCCGSSKM